MLARRASRRGNQLLALHNRAPLAGDASRTPRAYGAAHAGLADSPSRIAQQPTDQVGVRRIGRCFAAIVVDGMMNAYLGMGQAGLRFFIFQATVPRCGDKR